MRTTRLLLLTAILLLTVCCAAAESGAQQTSVCVRRQTPVDGDWFENACLMGDSIPESLANLDLIPELEIIVKMGQSPDGALNNHDFKLDGNYVTMAEYVAARAPGKLLIMLGSNGLDHSEPDEVESSYRDLLDLLEDRLPETEFYLVSVTPIAPAGTERYPRLTMPVIERFNAMLYGEAERRGLRYVDVFTPLLNEEGTAIDSELCAGDGIHLTRKGSQIVADEIRLQVGDPRE